jgi:hypothetical protein
MFQEEVMRSSRSRPKRQDVRYSQPVARSQPRIGAIEWAFAEGLTKYSLGATNLFLRKFGGEILATTGHRVDRSRLRRHTIGDWIADSIEEIRPLIPQRAAGFHRSLRNRVKKLRYNGGRLAL